ncbi:hypothetical protein AX774_g6831 [Zancudomyces culisetae]|uniref:Uncharacterized protein n=1 Tax=Zancudomyces culisetae TaxID=1213189 RepID=A0A1R1PFQ7_ZANCU|nr:hypothetical protein AX774_g6831 [Zancudomyces culisetae]|eukprot:OMH79748.1 hypothetical protein AX774_g6831 [Zancudomyces culisetae]
MACFSIWRASMIVDEEKYIYLDQVFIVQFYFLCVFLIEQKEFNKLGVADTLLIATERVLSIKILRRKMVGNSPQWFWGRATVLSSWE